MLHNVSTFANCFALQILNEYNLAIRGRQPRQNKNMITAQSQIFVKCSLMSQKYLLMENIYR